MHRTPPNSTAGLIEALQPLQDFGLTPQEAIDVGFGHFPVAGEANWSDDWLMPRFTPSFHLHQGNDIFAPLNTPVRAVADGVVVHAGWNGGNGIQVHLRHRSGYETQYNHLSRISEGLRPGVRVRQKQIIGNVGATGLATGPHLDYRVARNGTFVNPLGERFIPGEPIPAAARPDFQRHARELLARLEATAPF